MRQLFAPLGRRAIWIAFAIVPLLGIIGVIVHFALNGTPGDFARNILLSFGIAFLIAGFVSYLTNQNGDYSSRPLQGVQRSRQRQIRRAVMCDRAGRLPVAERTLAHDFADAYVASTPSRVSSTILFLPGALCQSAAQLAHWQGDWWGWLLVTEFVLIALAMIVAIPLQVHWFRNARKLTEQNFSA
jgi:hypothetical protein